MSSNTALTVCSYTIQIKPIRAECTALPGKCEELSLSNQCVPGLVEEARGLHLEVTKLMTDLTAMKYELVKNILSRARSSPIQYIITDLKAALDDYRKAYDWTS